MRPKGKWTKARSKSSCLLPAAAHPLPRHSNQRLASAVHRWLLELWQRQVADACLKSYQPYRVEISKGRLHARLFFVPAASSVVTDSAQSGEPMESPDLKRAHRAFHKALGWMRSNLAQTLRLRKVPEISFQLTAPSLISELGDASASDSSPCPLSMLGPLLGKEHLV